MRQRLRRARDRIRTVTAMMHGVGHSGYRELGLIEKLGCFASNAGRLLLRGLKLQFDPRDLAFSQRKRTKTRVPESRFLRANRVLPALERFVAILALRIAVDNPVARPCLLQ